MAERRTIAVHAFDDARVHLALAYLGRLKQGRLETLCGRLAVTQLSPFAVAAGKAADRCRVCFGKVDDDGLLKAELVVQRPRKAKPEPEAEVIDLAAARAAKGAPAGASGESATAADPALEVNPAAKKAKAAGQPGTAAKVTVKKRPAPEAKPAAKAKPATKGKPRKPR